MAARKKKRPLRPRVPSRVKKRTARPRSEHENELLGLALLALGLVLAAILYLGLDGGAVGSWLADALTEVIGNAAYVLPLTFLALGALLLARSDLLEVRPFRLGVGVSFLGLMTLLGKDSGGWIGMALGGTLAALIGTTGAAIIGGALLIAGLLLVTGASTGAILRRTGHVVRRAGTGAKRAFEWPSGESQTGEDVDRAVPTPAPVAIQHRLLDGAEAYPDVVGPTASSEEAAALVPDEPEPDLESVESAFEMSSEHSEYRLPDRDLLRSSPAGATAKSDTSAKTADLLVRTLSEFGVDATVLGQISGPRVTRYELQLAPGTKVSKVAGLKDDLELRPRDDRDPHPRADPRQAGGRRRGSEPLAEARHARRHLRRPARKCQPAVGLARQGHLRERDLDRPRPHAAPPDRGHDRIGEVRAASTRSSRRRSFARHRTRCA